MIQRRAKPIPGRISGQAHSVGRGSVVSMDGPVMGRLDLDAGTGEQVCGRERKPGVLGPNQCILGDALWSWHLEVRRGFLCCNKTQSIHH